MPEVSSADTTLSFQKDWAVYTNLKSLKDPIQSQVPVHFRFSSIKEISLSAIIHILDRYLIHLDLIHVRESIYAALRELITNAIKANAKRLYFEKNGKDITDPTSYQQGILHFKSEYLANKQSFDKELSTSPYSVIVTLAFNKDMLRIRVMNNISLTPDELQKIQSKLEKAQKYDDLAEALMDAGDDTEGAGLGLIMTLMMLKNDGIPPHGFKYNSQNGKTIVVIDIPLDAGQGNPQLEKANHLLKEVDNLPAFPKAIQDIQEAIDKPHSSISSIGSMIQKDISLSASVLKLANSAAYRRGDRIQALDRAIQMIGLKELQTILYSLGTSTIMEDKFPAFTEIWDRSNESAFYSRLIGKKMLLEKELQSSLMSCALLHDIGEIVLLSLEIDKLAAAQNYSQTKEFSSTLSMEESMFGITHTKLGAMIAEKWMFPEVFSVTMEYHHKPLQTPEGFQEIVYPIYLSDMMIKINYNEARASEIPEKVLAVCGFKSLGELQSFRTTALEEFKNS